MKRLRIGLFSLFVVFVILQVLPKNRTNPVVDAGTDLLAVADVPVEVRQILQRSCYDCHSNQTRWPWYSNVAPAGQWLVHHVDEARHHLNFSDWNSITAHRRAKLMKEMAEEVSEGHMPLHSYLWMHREAKLTEDERSLFADWCESRRAELEQEMDETR
jgi:uncharacterized membrane protein